MSRRGERILWKIVEFLGHAAIIGWIPPPDAFVSSHRADADPPGPAGAEPLIDPVELDEWLASILGAEPDPD
jgi:hypothetical protein